MIDISLVNEVLGKVATNCYAFKHLRYLVVCWVFDSRNLYEYLSSTFILIFLQVPEILGGGFKYNDWVLRKVLDFGTLVHLQLLAKCPCNCKTQ